MRESAQERVRQTARSAVERGRAIQCARLDMPWARCAPARLARESILSGFFGPVMSWYVRRRIAGREVFNGVRPPVVFVANHSSHMDTPAILRALPRPWRQRTSVAAAADYFYRKRWVAAIVSLLFSTVPIQRKGGGMEKGSADHLHRLLRQRWNLLIYAESTRSRDGSRGKLHSGAAVLAATNDVPIVPIYVSGTNAAMPPGRTWPRRWRAGMFAHRYPIEVRFGPPIRALPGEHRNETMARVQKWFDAQEPKAPPAAPRTTRSGATAAEERRMAAAGSR
ncbi:MAG TPA: lysophospholipid acyltransferase family protein [Solirubrobacteraceae bacterium]|nr:lysophospholipid acyltransferase family protein [Solirubrobacteraceae bacterium]